MKLSFVSIAELEAHLGELSLEAREEAEFYLSQSAEMSDMTEEILAQISHGCLLFRNFSAETGYYFQSPLPLFDGADTEAAFADISEYCRLEAIPECIIGIPEEDLQLAIRGVRHKRISEAEDGTFDLTVLTECMLLEELPELMYEDIYLGEFALSYAREYEKLVTDRHLNRFFGYNVTEDIKEGTGEDFIKEARRELDAGEAMSFAVTVLSKEKTNVFIGEATLYAFDGRGGASVAFRVLPKWQGRGYGKKILAALTEVARGLSLDKLCAEVMEKNYPSLAVMRSLAGEEKYSDGKFLFTLSLN